MPLIDTKALLAEIDKEVPAKLQERVKKLLTVHRNNAAFIQTNLDKLIADLDSADTPQAVDTILRKNGNYHNGQ